MKKTVLLLGFLMLTVVTFGQYTGNKLPSGLTVADTASDADITVIQKAGETYVKGIRMDSLRSYITEGINADITSLDSVAGDFGQFVISDGVGFLSPVSAKYLGNDAYDFGYRAGSVGYGSMVFQGLPTTVYKNTGSSTNAMVWGRSNEVTGNAGTCWGYNNAVKGQYGTAWGQQSYVGSLGGTAWNRGYVTGVSGTAFGDSTISATLLETSLGRFNDTITGGNAVSWVATDQLFTIGNGSSGSSRNNALTILKNGNTTIDGNLTADTIIGYVQSQSSFGELWVADGVTAQSIGTGATYTKLTGFVRRGSYENMTVDSTDDKITITQTGYYLVNVAVSSICGTNGVVSRTAIFVGGAEQDKIHAMQTISNTASPNPISCSGIIKVTTVPVDVDVRRRHDNGGSVNFTVVYANLSVHKIAEL